MVDLPKDLILVEQTYGNGEKTMYHVSLSAYQNAVSGKSGGDDYWKKRVWMYKDDKINHVAHVDTLKIIPPDEPSYDYYLQQYE